MTSEAKVVVLDFDGVLVDLKIDWERVKRKLNKFLEEQGVNGIKFGPIMSSLHALSRISPAKAWRASELLCEEEVKGLSLESAVNVREVILTLKNRGYRVVVWTRNCEKAVAEFLRALGLNVDAIYARERFLKAGLPDKDLSIVLEELSVDPASCVVASDHVKDIALAKAMGCFAIGVASHRFSRDELLAHGADLVLDDIRGLPAAILDYKPRSKD